MKILISGSTGLVGSDLVPFLRNQGHSVTRLQRSNTKKADDAIVWDPVNKLYNKEEFEGFDAVINLAGENVMGLWDDKKKKRIRDSRVQTTQALVEILKRLQNPPKVFVNASASGFYGDQGELILTEETPKGTGFLSDVCQQWEAAAEEAQQIGVRVVCTRFGIVLTPKGGALGKMLTPFKLCLGGILGSGKQYMSWILLEELLQIIHFALTHESIQGPLNVDTPNPVTNAEFTRALGQVLQRPTALAVPEFLLKTIFGEVAQEMLLSSVRMVPKKLQDAGYQFQFPSLDSALKHILIGSQ